MYLRRKLREEGGFTLAEILIAGVIMAVALIPLARMFNTSFMGVRTYEKVRDSVNCAKAAVEQIRSMPFYEPYSSAKGDVDIDDHFWGDRNPINDNPETTIPEGGTSPDWVNIPAVTYLDYGQFVNYEEFKVGIKLSYLDNDTGVSTMRDDWGPKIFGHDRPMNSSNSMIHILLIQVNVFWQTESGESSYALEQVVTDTEAIYNVGVSKIIVTGPPEVQDPARANGAAHWPGVDITVEIEGYGFKEDAQAWLVRNKYDDIPITDLVYVDEEKLTGTLRLDAASGPSIPDEPNFSPKAAVGYWSVLVKQEVIVSSYLFNGFVAEYPKPVIETYGNAPDMLVRESVNDQSNVSIKATGGPFVNKIENPRMGLVRYGADNTILNQIMGTVTGVTVPAGTQGYAAAGCSITATFDFTGEPPGQYQLVVYNTDTTRIGHTASDPSPLIYTITAVPPVVNDVFVSGTDPKRRIAYQDLAGGMARIEIAGSYFNAVDSPYVYVHLCDAIDGDGNPAGNVLPGTVVSVTPTSIIADFDVSKIPAGFYNAHVENSNTNLKGWITAATPRLEVASQYNGEITSFEVNSDYGFYENYYDIQATITGSGFLDVTDVAITDGTVEYDDVEYATADDNTINVTSLNLIDCDHDHSWFVKLYVGPTYSMQEAFVITLGKAVILPRSNSKPAIRIQVPVSDVAWEWNEETLTRTAYAYRNRAAVFEVKGMGFPINGTTTLRVWRAGSSWSETGDFACQMNRQAKTVIITSPARSSADVWVIPNLNFSGEISVQRTGDTIYPADSYYDRWRSQRP